MTKGTFTRVLGVGRDSTLTTAAARALIKVPPHLLYLHPHT